VTWFALQGVDECPVLAELDGGAIPLHITRGEGAELPLARPLTRRKRGIDTVTTGRADTKGAIAAEAPMSHWLARFSRS